MLTTHDEVLVPHVPENGFQDYLFLPITCPGIK